MCDQSLAEAVADLRRQLERLKAEHSATRAWCRGLEDEQARLGEMMVDLQLVRMVHRS